MISVYPSTLPGEPIEVFSAHGVTIEQWLDQNMPGFEYRDEPPITVEVFGAIIPQEEWSTFVIKADHDVEIRPVPKGPVLIVAAVVAAVVAVAAAILLRPSAPTQPGTVGHARGSSIYEPGIEGNRPRLGGVLPEVFGRHKIYPDYMGPIRRRFIDQRTQAIDVMFCIGVGYYYVPHAEIRIGGTPISQLPGAINYEVFRPNESVLSHEARRRWYVAPEVGRTGGGSGIRLYHDEWAGPFMACPPNEQITMVEWDIFAPQGIGELLPNGSIGSRSFDVEMQYRPAGTNEAWTAVTRSQIGNTSDQLGWTYNAVLHSEMTPEVRVRRIGAEPGDSKVLSRLEWYGMKSEMRGRKSRYDYTTILSLTLVGTESIASQTDDKISCVVTRRLPVRRSGEEFPMQQTRDIADAFRYIARSAGYDDDDIDLDEIDRLDRLWRARGDTFDYVQSQEETVKESLNRVLRAGMAQLTITRDGKLSAVRDGPRDSFEDVYSAQNFASEMTMTASLPRPDDPNGVNVQYFDETSWKKEEIYCRLPGDAGDRAEKLVLEGVTQADQAYQIGMRRRREIKYRRKEYTFTTELDALNSEFMDYCAIVSDIPGEGQSMLITGRDTLPNGYRIHVSEPLDWSAGGPHVVAWRSPTGRLVGPYPAIQDDEYSLIVEGTEFPYIQSWREQTHVFFGPEETWVHPVLITLVEPRGFESVNVEAVGYDSRLYLDDDSTAP